MIRQLLDTLAGDLAAATGLPATADPAAPPPETPGARILVWDERWTWLESACAGPVEVDLVVGVLAGGTEKLQVDALRDAHDTVAAAVPARFALRSSEPAELREQPAYLIRLTTEVVL